MSLRRECMMETTSPLKTILKTEVLNKAYSMGGMFRRVRINALDDVNLDIRSAEPVIISLVGESGSGKTTLAKVVLRLVEPTSGRQRHCLRPPRCWLWEQT